MKLHHFIFNTCSGFHCPRTFSSSHGKSLSCNPDLDIELVNSPFLVLLLQVVSLCQLFIPCHSFPFIQAFITSYPEASMLSACGKTHGLN